MSTGVESAGRIGVDLGGTKIEAVLLDAGDAVAWRERVPTPRSYPATVAAVAALVKRIDAACQAEPPVGVGAPGAWVAAARAMKNCNATWLNGKPLLDDLEAALQTQAAGRPRPGASRRRRGVPRVRIANDANCFALSEALTGAGAGADVVFGVILGTGVGGGIVVHGRLLSGANAIAGEWGHAPLPYLRADPATAAVENALPDRPCYCGRINCVETFLSGPGLAATHRLLSGECSAPETVARTAASVDLYVAMLGRSLAQIVNVLDPDVIVLGGGVSNIPRLVEDASRALSRHVFSSEGRTALRIAEHGDSSGVLGACRLWPA